MTEREYYHHASESIQSGSYPLPRPPQFAIEHPVHSRFTVKQSYQFRYPAISNPVVDDDKIDYDIDGITPIVPLFQNFHHNSIPELTTRLVPSNMGGFVHNNSIVLGYMVEGLPKVYVPPVNCRYATEWNPPFPPWADYAISRVELRQGKTRVRLLKNPDGPIRQLVRSIGDKGDFE
jgi:hypothetical protein